VKSAPETPRLLLVVSYTNKRYQSVILDAPAIDCHRLVELIRPELWTIVRSTPPYRRYYLTLFSPSNKRLNPIIAVYLLCFYLGSVTRYRPHEFEKIQDSKYGMFIAEFLETEGLQFWTN
jgi:YaaC-like Protein